MLTVCEAVRAPNHGASQGALAETRVNPNMASGRIEVLGKTLEVCVAQTPPFLWTLTTL